VSDDNLFEWEAVVEGPAGTPYECGVFVARLLFPRDYPMSPPKMTFRSAMWHPNVYPSGDVCISILHAHARDPTSDERPEEQWTAVQSAEKVLMSVMSMLAEPNPNSPANVDAAVCPPARCLKTVL
jgi:ubiquitin-conjugating enzyme E2 G2